MALLEFLSHDSMDSDLAEIQWPPYNQTRGPLVLILVHIYAVLGVKISFFLEFPSFGFHNANFFFFSFSCLSNLIPALLPWELFLCTFVKCWRSSKSFHLATFQASAIWVTSSLHPLTRHIDILTIQKYIYFVTWFLPKNPYSTGKSLHTFPVDIPN